MKLLSSFIVLAFFLPALALAQVPAQTVPAFTFFKLNKKPFTEKDLAIGKPLLFVFFDTDCEHCRHAIGYINQHERELNKTAVYLVTLDDQSKSLPFLKKYGNKLLAKTNLLLLQDSQQQFILRFKPKKYPSIFLYTAKRSLVMYDDDEQNVAAFFTHIKALTK